MDIIERNTFLGPRISPKNNRTCGSTAVVRSLPMVFVVEDDPIVREVIRVFLEANCLAVECFDSAESFLNDHHPVAEACILVDLSLGGAMSGMDLLCRLQEDGHYLPSIVTSGNSDMAMAVQAMKSGAADYLIKPIKSDDLLSCIARVLAHSCFRCRYSISCRGRVDNQGRLSSRQKQIMGLILSGHPSKNIAADLGISQRTVESHRSEIMKKTGSKSIPELARISLATPWNGQDDPPACFAH